MRIIHFSDFHLQGGKILSLHKINAEKLLDALRMINRRYMLTKEFREEPSEVNCRLIEKMRHVLVHGYYTIETESLWDTIENDIPKLKPRIEKYLLEM